MIELLAALAISVVGEVLYPFEHEPFFKDVEKIRKPGGCWVYLAPDGKMVKMSGKEEKNE